MKERLNRLGEIWNALSTSQKFTMAGAFAGVLIVSAAILSFSGGSKDLRPLVSGADAADLGEVTEVLKANQIEFEYGSGGDSILVSADKLAAARMELAMKGLPKSGESVTKFLTKVILGLVTSFSELIIPVPFKGSWPEPFL